MSFHFLTWFDISVIGLVTISMIFGLLCGLTRSIVSFCGYALALVLAVLLSDVFADLFTGYVHSRASSIMLSAVIMFIVFSVIIRVVSDIAFSSLNSSYSTILDKSFGVLFGFIRGCLLSSFLFYLMIFIIPEINVKNRSDVFGDNTKLPSWARNSETLVLISKGARMVSMVLPNQFSTEINKSIDEVKSARSDRVFSNRTDDIGSLHKIFSLLPETVLNEIPQQDLIDIQDQSLSPAAKVDILKRISNIYAKYMSDNVYGSKEEKSANKHYHEVMSSIETEISKYNEETEDEE